MPPPDVRGPASAIADGGPREDDRLGRRDHSLGTAPDVDAQARRLIDKHGGRYSEAILRHWSPAASKALGIRPIADGHPAPETGLPQPTDTMGATP